MKFSYTLVGTGEQRRLNPLMQFYSVVLSYNLILLFI
jgi:hypothetical protein